ATLVREERLRQAPRPRPAIVRSSHGPDGKAKKTPFKRYRKLLALAGIIVAAFVSVWLRREPWPDLPGEMARVQQVRDEGERATRDYQPAKAIRLDGPDTDTAALLRGLPFVVRVDATGPAHARRRIIHLRDWHYTTYEAFVVALRTQRPDISAASAARQ